METDHSSEPNYENYFSEEELRSALGLDYKGVAGAIELLRRQKQVHTLNGLIETIRSSLNSVGSLQYTTSKSNAVSLLKVHEPEASEITVIVVDELVQETIRRLQTWQLQQSEDDSDESSNLEPPQALAA